MKKRIIDIIYVVLGCFILSLGVNLFILPQDILSGGVPGVAVSLEPLLNIPAEWLINILTISLFFVGFIFLGKGFAIKTVLSTVLYPLFITLTTPLVNYVSLGDSPILASLYAGIFTGLGVGLVYRVGASTGGMDIPPLIINKYFKLPLHKLVMMVDGLTVILGASVYGIEAALIGLISVYVSGIVINKVIEAGGAKAKQFMIISNKQDLIIKAVDKQLGRGATLLHAKGGYSKQEREVLMVVLYQKQFNKLKGIIDEIDPNAFVIVSDVYEVHGEGFTYLQEIS